MKREELEKYLGKRVKITLFDGEMFEGELHKTGEERFKDDPNLYIPQKRYFCINPQSCLFRSSHVTKIKQKGHEESENILTRRYDNKAQ